MPKTHLTPHASQYPDTFYRVSLKAVIRDDQGRVLLNKEHDADFWNLPGGGWSHEESEKQSLARELQEEVGYTGEFTMQPMNTAAFWLESKQAWLLWIVYDVRVENMIFSIGEDSSEIAFIDPAQLANPKRPEEQWIHQHLRRGDNQIAAQESTGATNLRLSEEELHNRLKLAKEQVSIGSRYAHHKGSKYTVLDLAITEKDNSVCVIYRAEYGNKLTFTRPLNSWLENVEYNGKTVKRFTRI